MKQLGHYRLASKEAGDDMTRARYVRDHGARLERRVNQPRLPGTEAAFIREARTKFPRSVKRVGDMKNLLVSGHNNIKIGRDVRKGHLRGYWIYTLSLEERKTCPTTCQHWQTCYGNNMPFAKRIDHTDPDFLPKLADEICTLCNAPSRLPKKGVLVRLHALGDFYSTAYVEFWRHALQENPRLAIYGYTGHPPGSLIGTFVGWMNNEFPGRSMIRYSNGGLPRMSTVSIGHVESCPPNAFVCPEQTGKTMGCDTCGACWGTSKNVAFLEH